MARTAQFVIFAYIVAAAVMCCAQPQPAAEVDNDEPHYIDGHHNPLHHDTEEEIMLHKQEFDDIDTDSDGRLQWAELVAAAKDEGITEAEVSDFVSELDLDGDSAISWQEYAAALFNQDFADAFDDIEETESELGGESDA